MKEKLKRIILACILTLSVFSFTAYAAKADTTLDPDTQATIEDIALKQFDAITNFSEEELDNLIDDYEYQQNTIIVNGLNSWKSSKKDLGEFVQHDTITSEKKSDGSYRVVINSTFTQRKGEFILGMDRKLQKFTEITFNAEYTFAEKMSQAFTNLVIGMGTVFAVLVFLTWVISLFELANKWQKKMEESKKAKAAAKAAQAAAAAPAPEKAAPAPAAAPAAPAPSALEIQAVIAAAIAAYEAESGSSIEKQPALANGISIRSIRRISKA